LKKIRDAARLIAQREKEALRRLGISADQLRSAPPISSVVKQAYGGLTQGLEALRFSSDLSAIAFVEKYDSIPARDRECLPWEAIALSAEIDPTRFMGAFIFAMQNYSANMVKIIALSNHPEIMRKRVEFAMQADGTRDRDVIDTGLGFLPTAKGSTFIINPQTPKKEEEEEPDGIDAPQDDLDYLFPDLIDTQQELVPVKARLLESGV
jgi:hypothetical protein